MDSMMYPLYLCPMRKISPFSTTIRLVASLNRPGPESPGCDHREAGHPVLKVFSRQQNPLWAVCRAADPLGSSLGSGPIFGSGLSLAVLGGSFFTNGAFPPCLRALILSSAFFGEKSGTAGTGLITGFSGGISWGSGVSLVDGCDSLPSAASIACSAFWAMGVGLSVRQK